MRSAFEIVPHLLSQFKKNKESLLTPLKLQKLLYYAQAWSLVFRGESLFREEIEAWVHGPVIPLVYQRYKHHGYTPIPLEDCCTKLADDEVTILNLVWMSYGKQSAKSLEDLTHSEYPWAKAREGVRADQLSTKKISIRDMRIYYKQFMESEQPPRISPVALRKKKEFSKKPTINNILIGMGSVLDIYPLPAQRSSYVPSDFADSLSDFESMTSDWEKVGGYIHNVIDVVREQSLLDYE